MKPVQKYQCEVCHTEYAEKADAVRCEKNHKVPQTIASARHIPFGQNKAGYPITITVGMNDGQEVTYKR